MAQDLMQQAIGTAVSKTAATTGLENTDILLLGIVVFATWKFTHWVVIGKKESEKKDETRASIKALHDDIRRSNARMDRYVLELRAKLDVLSKESEAIGSIATILDMYKTTIFEMSKNMELIKSKLF